MRCCIFKSFQFIYGKGFQTYHQYEGDQRWWKTLQQSYADYTALPAGNEKELSELISKINEVGKQIWN